MEAKNGIAFVRISELPKWQQAPFRAWLRCWPLIPGEKPRDCARFADYEKWRDQQPC